MKARGLGRVRRGRLWQLLRLNALFALAVLAVPRAGERMARSIALEDSAVRLGGHRSQGLHVIRLLRRLRALQAGAPEALLGAPHLLGHAPHGLEERLLGGGAAGQVAPMEAPGLGRVRGGWLRRPLRLHALLALAVPAVPRAEERLARSIALEDGAARLGGHRSQGLRVVRLLRRLRALRKQGKGAWRPESPPREACSVLRWQQEHHRRRCQGVALQQPRAGPPQGGEPAGLLP